MESMCLKALGEFIDNANEIVLCKYLKNIFFGGTHNVAIVNEAWLLSFK